MRTFLILSLGIMITGMGFGQTACELDSLSVTFSDCEDGQAAITINFVPPATRSTHFTVFGNDTTYGIFAYSDLPVKIKGIVVEANRNYVFHISDNEIDTCVGIFEYGRVDCRESECVISDLSVEVLDSCSLDGAYGVKVDFLSEGITQFDLYANWEFFGSYEIDELPLLIPDFPSRQEDYDLIKIYGNDGKECYEVIEFPAPICAQTKCGISDLSVKVIECSNASYFVRMDLEHYGPHSRTFVVSTTAEREMAYPYSSLPLVLGPYLIDSSEGVVFSVADLEDSLCVLEKVLEDIPCESTCKIGDINSTIIRCDSGSFDVTLHFEYKGSETDSFLLRGNGNLYGRYSYSDVPIQLLGLPADTGLEYEFSVVDQNDGDCFADIGIGPVHCKCYFPNLYVAGGDCTSDTTYAVELFFDLDSTETFSVNSCGIDLGSYSGADLPLRIADFPASGDEKDVIHLCFGSPDSSCCLAYEVTAPECAGRDCIFDVSADPGPCLNSREFYVEIDFASSEAEDADTFIVKKYGQVYGAFQYGDLPVKVGPFPSYQNTDSYQLDIYDLEFECHATVEVDVPQCGCDLFVEAKASCESDSIYELTIDLKSEQDFDVRLDGVHMGSFGPNDLPLTLTMLQAAEEYAYLEVCSTDGLCCAEKKIELPSCQSDGAPFSFITYEVSECDPNNGFFVTVNFDTIGICSDSFFVKGAGEKRKFSYGELPVRIGPFLAGSEFYSFKLYDEEVDGCTGSFSLGRVVCPQQCDFSSAEIFMEECVGEDYFILVVDSLLTNFPAFDLYYDSIPLGFYKTDQLPHRIKVPILEMDSVSIFACVSDNTSCCYTVMIPVPRCEERICELSELEIDTVECRGDSLWVNLSFDHGVSDSLFKLLVNQHEYGIFDASEIPLHIGPFLSGDNVSFEFMLEVLGHPDCAASMELQGVSCPASQIASGVKVLILQTDEKDVFVKVPDFISERTDLQLYDMQGRLIHNVTFSSDDRRAVVRTPQMVSGMYVVRLLSNDGVQFSRKIIVP